MAIIKRPDKPVLYSRFKFKGRVYLRSTGTNDRRKAEAWERRFRTELENSFAAPYPDLAKLRDLDVARMRMEGRNEQYIKNGVINKYKWLIEFFPDLRKINEETLRQYVEHRLAMGVRRQTISKELVCLKRGLRLADIPGPSYWPKLAKDKPDPKIASKEHSRERWLKWLSFLEGEALDLALFALLTGLRKEELYRVTREDVDGNMLTVREKAQRPEPRQVWLCETAMEIFQRAIPFHSDHKKAYKAAALQTGTTNITLRDCRAAFATAGQLGDARATYVALGQSGTPTWVFLGMNNDRFRKVAEAAEAWLRQ